MGVLNTNDNVNKDIEKKEEDQDSIDPIQRAIGDFGPWQLYAALALAVSRIPAAWHLLGIVFLAPNVDFNCTLAEGEVEPGSSFSSVDQSLIIQWLVAISGNWQGSEGNLAAIDDPRCYKNGKECVKWEYSEEIFKSTIITEWDLVCKKKELADVAQTVFMLGVLLGSVFFGMASDKWGRKKPLMFATVLQIIVSTASAFVNDYIVFLVLRFLEAVAVGGSLVVCFVLCVEYLSKKWRAVISTLYHIPFFLGHAMLPLISYYIRDWRDFQLAISIPLVVFLGYWWAIPESPRWLLTMGRKEEALKILQNIAKRNKLPKPEMEAICIEGSKDETLEKKGFIHIFMSPNLRKWSLSIFLNWFTTGFCYFGLAQYMSKMEGDIFINVAISGLVEMPGSLIAFYCTEKFGRKITLAVSSCFSGIACLCLIAIPKDADIYYTVVLAGLGVVGMAVAFPTVYLYSGEIFPTVVRNNGLGTCSMCARVGSMIAPFVSSMGGSVPSIVFGSVSIIAAAFTYFLPETKGMKLLNTIEEAEHFKPKAKTKKVGN